MPESPPGPQPDDEAPVEDLARQADDRNPEPVTRREALELELEDQDRSDEGAEVEIAEAVDADDG